MAKFQRWLHLGIHQKARNQKRRFNKHEMSTTGIQKISNPLKG